MTEYKKQTNSGHETHTFVRKNNEIEKTAGYRKVKSMIWFLFSIYRSTIILGGKSEYVLNLT